MVVSGGEVGWREKNVIVCDKMMNFYLSVGMQWLLPAVNPHHPLMVKRSLTGTYSIVTLDLKSLHTPVKLGGFCM